MDEMWMGALPPALAGLPRDISGKRKNRVLSCSGSALGWVQ